MHVREKWSRLADVVEQSQCEHDVKGARERHIEEVAMDDLRAIAEALEALVGELEHVLREIHTDPRGLILEQHELTDPTGAAPDVEDTRRAVGADGVESELATAEQSRSQHPREQPLVLVEIVKRPRVLVEVLSDSGWYLG